MDVKRGRVWAASAAGAGVRHFLRDVAERRDSGRVDDAHRGGRHDVFENANMNYGLGGFAGFCYEMRRRPRGDETEIYRMICGKLWALLRVRERARKRWRKTEETKQRKREEERGMADRERQQTRPL